MCIHVDVVLLEPPLRNKKTETKKEMNENHRRRESP